MTNAELPIKEYVYDPDETVYGEKMETYVLAKGCTIEHPSNIIALDPDNEDYSRILVYNKEGGEFSMLRADPGLFGFLCTTTQSARHLIKTVLWPDTEGMVDLATEKYVENRRQNEATEERRRLLFEKLNVALADFEGKTITDSLEDTMHRIIVLHTREVFEMVGEEDGLKIDYTVELCDSTANVKANNSFTLAILNGLNPYNKSEMAIAESTFRQSQIKEED